MPRPPAQDLASAPAPIDPAAMDEIRARLAAPWQRTADGYTADGGYRRPIWSPAGFLARGDRYVIVCRCGERRDAPLAQLVAAGRGDQPMHTLRWRLCARCGAAAFAFEAVRRTD